MLTNKPLIFLGTPTQVKDITSFLFFKNPSGRIIYFPPQVVTLYLFLAALGFPCCVGFSLVAKHGFLITMTSLVEEHQL